MRHTFGQAIDHNEFGRRRRGLPAKRLHHRFGGMKRDADGQERDVEQ